MSPAAETHVDLDAWARAEALDTRRSFIVRAPAGSGKTQLLTLRLLSLLSTVDEPEEVLAITFTKAATAEMRERVITALRRAASGEMLDEIEGSPAAAALEHARARGWGLLDQPHRLNIQTIDSLSLQIAHGAPLLSRLGGQLQPTEDSEPLYALAARRTMEQLGGSNVGLSDALKHLLRLRDVKLDNCESLIAEMLARRDEWLGQLSNVRQLHEEDWRLLRDQLEEPFRTERTQVMARVKHLLAGPAGEQLFELAAYACSNNPSAPIHGLKGLTRVDELEDISHFHCVRELLLTTGNEWRKSVNKAIGFPTPKDGGSAAHKQKFERLLAHFGTNDQLLEALCALRKLPEEKFSDDEWHTVRSIFTVLYYAAGQLRVVFAEKAKIDFVELGMTAGAALDDREECRRWSAKIRHLLVDEFQDTSRRQYELFKNLVRAWEPDEGRTWFVVGDPMQSIYLFRHADLALFNEVRRHGFHHDRDAFPFTELTLHRNWRSTAGLVEPLNKMFQEMAGKNRSGAREKSQFTAAVAREDTPAENAMAVVAQFTDDDHVAAASEAALAIDLIRPHLPAMDRARAEGREYRVGVLVRAKRHVAQIAAALRDASIGYRAIELETLEDRQEVRDLLSLVRALFSPVDRVAWLSVLRAPWCGLSLMDLHMLSGNDDPALLKKPIPEMLETRMALLSEDGARRAERVYRILRLAVDQRFSGQFSASPNGLAAWVERTWHSLGGHHCVDANAYENVQAFFRLLATMTPDGMDASLSLLKQRLEKFFAQPATEATEKNGVQLMTIHKAKGLGFDVVLTPSLGRPSGRTDNPLLQWMARTKHGSDERELLIAPIGSLGDEGSATYKWVGKQREHEEREELNRLLYVACTRARSELYLFGSVGVKDGKIKKPETGTLLATGWAYLERIFQEQFAERQAAGPVPVVARHASTGTDPGVRSETWATPFPGELKIAARASGQILRRLPVDWDEGAEAASSTSPSVTRDDRDSSERSLTVAGLTARAVGVVVHALFQQMAGLADDDPRRDVIASTDYWQNVGRVLLRNEGLSAKDVAAQMGQVITMLRTAAGDATGRWILARRREARSESAWTSYGEEGVRTVRADRVFIAGSEPLSSADSHLWVVDYKTGEMENLNLLAGAPGEGSRYKEQLQQYGRVLREALGGALPLRFALYYPAAPHLDWWRE